MRALERSRSGKSVEAAVDREALGELVADGGEERVLIGRVHRPDDDVVDQLRTAQPSFEEHHHAMRIDVAAAVGDARVAEMIGVGLFAGHLIDEAKQRIGAHTELAEVGSSDQETLAWIEDAPFVDAWGRFLGHGRGGGGSDGAVAVLASANTPEH